MSGEPLDWDAGGTPSLPASAEPNAAGATPATEITEDQVRLALRRVKDPDINLNIVDLGLIYDILIEGRDVIVAMSLTSPACPAGPQILHEAERELRALPGVGEVRIDLVWSPPWTPDRIEPRVRAYLGF
jgi:metal-sulfur cluster biosynthetic enzyme